MRPLPKLVGFIRRDGRSGDEVPHRVFPLDQATFGPRGDVRAAEEKGRSRYETPLRQDVTHEGAREHVSYVQTSFSEVIDCAIQWYPVLLTDMQLRVTEPSAIHSRRLLWLDLVIILILLETSLHIIIKAIKGLPARVVGQT